MDSGSIKQEPDGGASDAASVSGSSVGGLRHTLRAGSSGSNLSYAQQQQQQEAAEARARHSRDERKARELGIAFSIDDIINLPMDEFNDLLSKHDLTEEQLNLCRDIRRRGKNKVAAQNCRKRKIDQIAQLELQVEEARRRKRKLMSEREVLYRQRAEWASKLNVLESDILTGMSKSPKEFSLDFSAADVRVVRQRGGGPAGERGAAAPAAAGHSQVRQDCTFVYRVAHSLTNFIQSLGQRDVRWCPCRSRPIPPPSPPPPPRSAIHVEAGGRRGRKPRDQAQLNGENEKSHLGRQWKSEKIAT